MNSTNQTKIRKLCIWPVLLAIAYCFAPYTVQAFQLQTVPFTWPDRTEEYLVRSFDTEDGLPVNTMSTMVHHTDGYMYFGTTDGLVRYDGHRFHTFTSSNTPVLQSNRIFYLFSALDDELWIIDEFSNLYRYKDGIFERLQDIDLYKDLRIRFATTARGEFWINAYGNFWRQKEGMEFELFEHSGGPGSITSFYINQHSGTIYYNNDKGLYSAYNGVEALIASREEEPELVNSTIFSANDNDDIWLLNGVTQNVLLHITKEGITKVPKPGEYSELHYYEARLLNDQEIILHTDHGYLLYDKQRNKFMPTALMQQGLEYANGWITILENEKKVQVLGGNLYIDEELVFESDAVINNVTLDLEGSIWMGTSRGGVYQLSRKKFLTVGNTTIEGLQNVYGIFEDKDNDIWAPSFNDGIFKLDGSNITHWKRGKNASYMSFLKTMHEAPSGDLYALGHDVFWKYDSGGWVRESPEIPGTVNALFVDSQERIWVGGSQGLFIYENDEPAPFKDPNGIHVSNINSIQELSDGTLIITSGESGLAFLTPDNELRLITSLDGLSSNIIRDAYAVSKDTLWVSSADKGLNRLVIHDDYTPKEIVHIDSRDGLINNSLHRMIKDSFGYFWINSNGGIMRVSEQALNAYADKQISNLPVQGFLSNDGLENVEGNGGTQHAGILTRDGKLLFPNQAGIVYTRPEWHLTDSTNILHHPIFENISYSDTSFVVSDKSLLTLPITVRDIQVEFTLPTFTTPDKLEMEYKMEGVNENWQHAGADRLAVFTNLPPGTHSLTVRARLIGSRQYLSKTMNIEVLPLFVETIWFTLLMVIVGFILIYAVFRVLLSQGKRREEKLTMLVNERTQELIIEKEKTEEALQQIKKLGESKSRFFTNFTHELRTPLSLILNPLDDMLEGGQFGETASNANSLALMKRSAVRLKGLVNQLLDVSKLTSGELKMTFEPVQLCQLTSQIAAQFEHSLAKKEITFEVLNDCPENLIYVDINAWNHICTNLLSNAVKFTPSHGSISVSMQDKNDHIICSVADTGIGIPEADQSRVFDAYYQGDSSISKAEGTGIGLSLVKGLMERMGGSIEVESEIGKGTTFTMLIKKGSGHIEAPDTIIYKRSEAVAVEVPLPEPISEVTHETVDTNQTADNQRTFDAKVLLVEDNEDFRTYLNSVISNDYEVMVAGNGKEGLDALEHYKPDLIVSDIMMPEMNGYEMMQEIRDREEYKTIPFVFLSAKDSASDIETGINLGADIYLPKPVKNSLLLTHIKALLRREKRLTAGTFNEEEKVLPKIVRDVHEVIYRHLGNPDLSVDFISATLATSSPSLYRKWKNETDKTIKQTITDLRLQEAIKLVKEEQLSISEAMYATGFNSLSSFSRVFKRSYGSSPREYLKQNA